MGDCPEKEKSNLWYAMEEAEENHTNQKNRRTKGIRGKD